MNGFKEYLIQEYINDVKGYKAVEFKFSYSLKSKPVKGVNRTFDRTIDINVIHIRIRFVDESLKTLLIDNITFENNTLTKSTINKLKNISGKELVIKFNIAKAEIVRSIIDEHQQKIKELNNQISNLQTYQGGFNNIIPNQFQCECVNLTESVNNPLIKKQSFEM